MPEQVAWVELRGPTDCTVWTTAQWDALRERLGPDPLDGDAPEKAYERIAKSKKAIGQLLMEQEVIAGIGNIYRAELLFRARVSPFRPGNEVPEQVLYGLWKDALELMPRAMVDRRIVTTRAKDRPHPRGKAQRDEVHYVYRRHGQPCFVCGTSIRRVDMVGRTLYWCPTCQPGEPSAPRKPDASRVKQ